MNLNYLNNKPTIRNLKRKCDPKETYAYGYSFRRPRTTYKDEYEGYRKNYTSENSKLEVSCVGAEIYKLL